MGYISALTYYLLYIVDRFLRDVWHKKPVDDRARPTAASRVISWCILCCRAASRARQNGRQRIRVRCATIRQSSLPLPGLAINWKSEYEGIPADRFSRSFAFSRSRKSRNRTGFTAIFCFLGLFIDSFLYLLCCTVFVWIKQCGQCKHKTQRHTFNIQNVLKNKRVMAKNSI